MLLNSSVYIKWKFEFLRDVECYHCHSIRGQRAKEPERCFPINTIFFRHKDLGRKQFLLIRKVILSRKRCKSLRTVLVRDVFEKN